MNASEKREGDLSRRDFLKTGAMAGAGAMLFGSGRAFSEMTGGERPNIIYIFTDQQSATMMSCAGNPWLKTPAMDYLAANGVRFERAYTTNPVCVPARIGMMTGRFPSAFRHPGGEVRENDGGMKVPSISDELRTTTIPAQLAGAGYELAYGGKVHLPKPLNPGDLGFEVISQDERAGLAEDCAEFIKRPHDKPYFLMASFINPHDICYMALNGLTFDRPGYNAGTKLNPAQQTLLRALEIPPGMGADEFFEKYCPPVPPNFEPQAGEPAAIVNLLKKRNFRMSARENYTERDWRLHRWAYCRLTEVVDRQIQTVLDALKASGQEENTIVIFSSDHGDMDAAHRMEHKSTLYDESARIPFIVMHKGCIPGGRVDREHLVSNGLDLLPTLCDYAGAQTRPADPRGRSLRPLIEGRESPGWRTSLGVESQVGRMVVSGPYKYIRYDLGVKEEQLLDLATDPGETRHFTREASHAAALNSLRDEYAAWFPER